MTSSLFKILTGVSVVHFLFIVWISWKTQPFPEQQLKHKVLVQTVALSPSVSKSVEKKGQPIKKPIPQKKKEDAPNSEELRKIVEKYNTSRGKVTSKKSETTVPEAIVKLEINQAPEFYSGYQDLLAARLREALRLPEYGEVKIHLTLDRNGQVKKVEIISAKSEKNKEYLLKKLSSLTLPPFGTRLSANQHTFTLALKND